MRQCAAFSRFAKKHKFCQWRSGGGDDGDREWLFNFIHSVFVFFFGISHNYQFAHTHTHTDRGIRRCWMRRSSIFLFSFLSALKICRPQSSAQIKNEIIYYTTWAGRIMTEYSSSRLVVRYRRFAVNRHFIDGGMSSSSKWCVHAMGSQGCHLNLKCRGVRAFVNSHQWMLRCKFASILRRRGKSQGPYQIRCQKW